MKPWVGPFLFHRRWNRGSGSVMWPQLHRRLKKELNLNPSFVLVFTSKPNFMIVNIWQLSGDPIPYFPKVIYYLFSIAKYAPHIREPCYSNSLTLARNNFFFFFFLKPGTFWSTCHGGTLSKCHLIYPTRNSSIFPNRTKSLKTLWVVELETSEHPPMGNSSIRCPCNQRY